MMHSDHLRAGLKSRQSQGTYNIQFCREYYPTEQAGFLQYATELVLDHMDNPKCVYQHCTHSGQLSKFMGDFAELKLLHITDCCKICDWGLISRVPSITCLEIVEHSDYTLLK